MSEPSFEELMEQAERRPMNNTIGEMQFMNGLVANTNRIANALEGIVRHSEMFSPKCTAVGCTKPNVVRINGAGWCEDHIDQGFAFLEAIKQAVREAQESP